MQRLSFILEICHPGSVPDPPLVAAVLDLVCYAEGCFVLSVYSNIWVLWIWGTNHKNRSFYSIWWISETVEFSNSSHRCVLGQLHGINLFFQPRTPVIARAAFLLECSYYVHCFNKGQWPLWTKLNLPGFRQSNAGPVPCTRSSTAPNGLRRAQLLQRSAGKMFHLWAEVNSVQFSECGSRHVPHIFRFLLGYCNPVGGNVGQRRGKHSPPHQQYSRRK